MKSLSASTLAGAFLAFVLPSGLFAQKSPKESAQVWLGVHAQITAGAAYTLEVQSSNPSESDPYNGTLTNFGGNSTPVQTPNLFFQVTPGRIYTLSISCSSWHAADVQFNTPPGYTLFMGKPDSPLTPHTTFPTDDFGAGSGTYAVQFYVQPSDGASKVAPGYALPPRVGDVTWAISAGTLSNGSSAGTLRWRSGSVSQDLLDASSLNYVGPTTTEVATYTYSDGTIKYIGTNQVQIYVRRNAGTDSGYKVEVYGPSVPYTYTGGDITQDWNFSSTDNFEYTLSNPDSSWLGRVQIARLDRASGRTDTWVLSQSGGTTTLTQTSSLRVITHVSTAGPGSGQRTETITVADNSSTVAVKKKRIYQTYAWGEELIQDIADPDGMALTTTYDYYSTTVGDGHYSKLKSVVKPDGSWVLYDYYDDFAKWGELSAVYAPWQDAPTAPSLATTTNCQVTTYTYAGERGVFQELSTGTQSSVTGTVVGKTTIGSAFSTNSAYHTTATGDQPMRTDTVHAYASSGSYQTTVRTVFHDTADPLYNGKLYSQVNPDGTKVSASYFTADLTNDTHGSGWAGTAVSPDSGANTWCETYFYGTAAQNSDSTATQFTTDGFTGGKPIDAVWMTPNRSYRRQIFRDPAGNPLFDMTQVYTGSGFQLVSWTECTYSADGLPLTCQKSDGELTTYSYVDGKVGTQVDPDGTRTDYTFDSLMRVTKAEKHSVAASGGYAAQDPIDTNYTYDAAGHVLTTTLQASTGGASLTSSIAYNLVGLPTSQTSPSGLATSLAYANGGRTVTATLPGGATQVSDNYLDTSAKSVTGTGVVAQYATRTVNGDGTITTQVNVGSSGSARLAATTTDWLGRTISATKPAFGGGTLTAQSFYNTAGQLVKVTQPGMAPLLYQYDSLGELQYTGLDVNNNGTLDLGGTDRVTQVRTQIVSQGGAWWSQSQTYVYNQASSSTPLLQSQTLQKLAPYDYSGGNYDGGTALGETDVTDIFGNVTVQKTVGNRSSSLVTQTTTLPDSSTPQVSIAYNRLMVSQQNAQGQATTFQHDSLGRQTGATDPRTGTSHISYFTSGTGANGQVSSTQDAAGNTTSFTYDASDGLLASSTDPAGGTVYHAYDYLGREIKTWGTAALPAALAYNSLGDQVAQRTFRDTSIVFSSSSWPLSDDGGDARNPNPASWSNGDKTAWAYDTATGLLTSKTDAASHAVGYAYTSAGQLSTRTWSRGTVTTYSYDANTGEQTGISYSDGTPALTYTYDRMGRSASASQNYGSFTLATTLQHHASGKLTGELFDGTFFGGRQVTWQLAGSGVVGRTIGHELGTSGSPASELGVGYGYDSLGRFNAVSVSGGPSFTYSFLANSNLIASVSDSADHWTQTRTWVSNRDLLDTIETDEQSVDIGRFHYAYDSLGRRTSKVSTGTLFNRYQAGGVAEDYGYDARSQLTSATTYQSTDPSVTTTPMLGRTFTYSYDQIGSRLTSSVDGTSASYTNNNLNQVTSRTVPGGVAVSGLAPTGATIAVNSSNLSSGQSQGQYYWASLAVGNSSAPAYLTYAISSSLGGSATRNAFLPQTPESFTYDADGNVTSDGRWHYFWDGENRLKAMETYGNQSGDSTAVWTSGVPRQHLDFMYDYMNRRISKKLSTWSGSAWTVASETRFVYANWSLIADYAVSGSTLVLAHTYVWGIDLSGDLEHAGGVGGLLAVTSASGTTNLPVYDGNGNVMGLLDRATGLTNAAYEYSPFGQTLRSTGAYAQSNPFRFSSKYTDDETQLIYYGNRYYQPTLGRWLGRDPLEEKGGLHLYGFCANNAVNRYDILGMLHVEWSDSMQRYVWVSDPGDDSQDGEDVDQHEDQIDQTDYGTGDDPFNQFGGKTELTGVTDNQTIDPGLTTAADLQAQQTWVKGQTDNKYVVKAGESTVVNYLDSNPAPAPSDSDPESVDDLPLSDDPSSAEPVSTPISSGAAPSAQAVAPAAVQPPPAASPSAGQAASVSPAPAAPATANTGGGFFATLNAIGSHLPGASAMNDAFNSFSAGNIAQGAIALTNSLVTAAVTAYAAVTGGGALVDGVQGLITAAESETAAGRVFWSGRQGANQTAAEAFAQQTGQTTLEMTPTGQALTAQGAGIDAWRSASADFASGASGDVTSFAGGSSPTSVWNTVEKPILMQNPNVTRIIVKDAVNTAKTTIIYPH